MERRIYTNEFEQVLKEAADQFQMTPSTRVWHGIYNDIHPGRRWPSITMALLLVFTLVVIGHLNTNNSKNATYNKTSGLISTNSTITKDNQQISKQNTVIKKTDLNNVKETIIYSTNKAGNLNSTTSYAHLSTTIENNNGTKALLVPATKQKQYGSKENIIFDKEDVVNNEQKVKAETYVSTTSSNNSRKKFSSIENASAGLSVGKLPEKAVVATANSVQYENENSTLQNKDGSVEKMNDVTISEQKREKQNTNNTTLIDDQDKNRTAVKTTKSHPKKNSKITWVYFVAPVVSNVIFNGKPVHQQAMLNLSQATPGNINPDKPGKMLHNAALGFETGILMNYTFAPKLKFIAGAHLTYSGYHTISNEVHPTYATLILKEKSGVAYSRNFITHYGDGRGYTLVSLRNYSWQASIPLGLDYEFSGNDKVHFNVSGAIEPSVVLRTNAYIPSSDGRYYVNEPTLLRKWNMSSNFGAYVSFNSTKFKWRIGPNVRYQWFSTYKDEYQLKEHLIDYGIRLAVSK